MNGSWKVGRVIFQCVGVTDKWRGSYGEVYTLERIFRYD